MKRVNAIAAAGAAILAIGVYLADSGILLPASSGVVAVAETPPSVAPSPTFEFSSPAQAAELDALLAEFGVVASTPSEIAAATGAPSSSAPSAAGQAALETVELKVDGMWCASCGYFVQQALVGTPGVVSAEVSTRTETAVVTFDPAKVGVARLLAATASYGFPARLLSQ